MNYTKKGKILERFLRYVKTDTQSDPESDPPSMTSSFIKVMHMDLTVSVLPA